LEKLETSEKHSRPKDGTISPQCEHCLRQVEKIEYLMKTLSKFTLERSNLDVVLGSQRSVLNKEGIGYSGKFNPLGTRNFLNMSKPTSVICSYYSKFGHASNSCYFKNCGVSKGEYKWVPKGYLTKPINSHVTRGDNNKGQILGIAKVKSASSIVIKNNCWLKYSHILNLLYVCSLKRK